jgi:TatD DNase family protein
MLVFRQAVEVSEELSKPLIIHCVKAHDIIAQLRREMKPRMDWIIHGFRGKPTVAQILLQSGCSLSYGEQFNPESLAVTPLDRLYAETDTSTLSIDAIVQALSASRGVDLTQTVIDNVARLL